MTYGDLLGVPADTKVTLSYRIGTSRASVDATIKPRTIGLVTVPVTTDRPVIGLGTQELIIGTNGAGGLRAYPPRHPDAAISVEVSLGS